MNGHGHYTEAARLMEYVEDGALQDGIHLSVEATTEITARAQVHATLALVAATVMPALLAMCGDSDRITDWGKAVGWNTAAPVESIPLAPSCGIGGCYLPKGHEEHKEIPF